MLDDILMFDFQVWKDNLYCKVVRHLPPTVVVGPVCLLQSKAGTKLISFVKNGWNSSIAVCTWQNAICFAHWTNIPFGKRRSEPTYVLQGQLNPAGLTREKVLVKLSYVKLCNVIRYQQTGLLHHITLYLFW